MNKNKIIQNTNNLRENDYSIVTIIAYKSCELVISWKVIILERFII